VTASVTEPGDSNLSDATGPWLDDRPTYDHGRW